MSFLTDMWAADKSADATRDAANTASRTQLEMFNKAMGLQEPFRQGSLEAMKYMQGLLGIGGDPEAAKRAFDAYQNSTGYQFRLGQGTQAIDRSAAARGGLNSGATLKALERYGQNLGSQEFGNYLGQLNSLFAPGPNTAANLGQQAIGTGNSMANNTMMAGQARASAYGQIGNSAGTAINRGIGYYWG